ncbi:hypothetical protein AVEN_101677-1 [Araneus ventricosus]|uniref:Uncharacterized protein n=1 Tax=Araneus ventricosus TaxID=182803 RepID=A0A4Y2WHM2_ARAVE|nr:hypothetical protein AVEN_101677-1 [Araneus ventricosus]
MLRIFANRDKRGRRGLEVRCRLQGRRVLESKPDSTEDLPYTNVSDEPIQVLIGADIMGKLLTGKKAYCPQV